MTNQIEVSKRTKRSKRSKGYWNSFLIYILSVVVMGGVFIAFGLPSLPLITGVMTFVVVKTYIEWLWESVAYGYLVGASSAFTIGYLTYYALHSMEVFV